MAKLNSFVELNANAEKTLNNLRNAIQSLLAERLSNYGEAIIIGNMVYGIVNGVPAYCYFRDYATEREGFLPIWDKENSGEYGWSDFNEVAKIYDMINDYARKL